MSLYPNPLTVTDELNIETGVPEKITSIAIYDVNAKPLLRTPWAPTINIKSICAGLYLVQITYIDGSVSSHRIVKQ